MTQTLLNDIFLTQTLVYIVRSLHSLLVYSIIGDHHLQRRGSQHALAILFQYQMYEDFNSL